ncbi:ABC transporter substrate-binding protein [Tumebacillus permanentifrigoris]|uniref:Carbohydrate ABC transporter substrate-binding protein (CUT1 family) n=1 Tax=Tumebacillus permanentifrigoris TaxID=378543 RepID=A0A316DF49_9BACL|nr:ABC transporter substrate-binding protein [Tumebacillus permanentifrigoris]PWK16575.1 carbohydrate ABC transporter substrate-binding protein (CUT1 family) [Tumebacillus permanentifrigoris]
MKKGLLVFSTALVSLSVLTACNSKETAEPSTASGEVTIQYWHTLTEEDRVKVLKDMLQTFEAENKGIHVEQVPVPEEDFPNKISAALGANKLPALIEGGIDQMLFLGTEGVTDETGHEALIKEVGQDDFYKGALDTLKDPKQAGYYGVPIAGWVQGIWYDQKLFKEKGLEPPATWDNILKAAKAFHDPSNQKYGIVIGTAKEDFTEQTFSQFALSDNALVFGKDGNVKFDTPEMVDSLTYYKNLSQYTPPGAESWREAREMYLSGRAPMVMYSTYLMGDLSQNPELAKNTGFAIPENKGKASFGQITGLTITNTVSDQQRAAAKKLVAFFMKKENNIKYLHMSPGGSNPVRKSVTQDPAYLDNDVLKAFGSTAKDIPAGLENLQRFGFQDGVVYPSMGDISAQNIIAEAVYDMTEHGKDPAEVAKTAQQKMEKSVKK